MISEIIHPYFSEDVRPTLVCRPLMRKPLTNASDKLKFVGHCHYLRASRCDINDFSGVLTMIRMEGVGKFYCASGAFGAERGLRQSHYPSGWLAGRPAGWLAGRLVAGAGLNANRLQRADDHAVIIVFNRDLDCRRN
jgi:hypothetical protein